MDEAGQAVIWFSVAMTASRFSGDWLAERVAPHLLLAVPMLGAALLLGLAALSSMVEHTHNSLRADGASSGETLFPSLFRKPGRQLATAHSATFQ